MRIRAIRRRQAGFLVIAGVFLLVVLAGLVAYLTTVSTTQQAASAADLNSARAYQAARAGAEWGVFQILQNTGGAFKTSCDGTGSATNTLTFTSTLASFEAKVTCTTGAAYTEGAASVRVYRIVSNACNVPTCPNTATASATYVEREISVTITD
jgi:MSHA biogenesis protein MshP